MDVSKIDINCQAKLERISIGHDISITAPDEAVKVDHIQTISNSAFLTIKPSNNLPHGKDITKFL